MATSTGRELEDRPDMTRSSRSPEEIGRALESWLATKLPEGASPKISNTSTPGDTGMSSETVLFDTTWTQSGNEENASLVARVSPNLADVPVFRSYDLDAQFKLLRIAGNHGVPVPNARWIEQDDSWLGDPFLVMDKVDGRVPPDVMPYTMEGWLLESDPADQRHLQDATVEVLTRLHAIDISMIDTDFLEYDTPGDTHLRRHLQHYLDYYDWVRGDMRFPVVDRAIAWLEENFPTDEGEPVISWGDSRIGNVLYDGFEPVAVLDWEMAAIGPRELDLGWMVFLHTFFEDIAHQMELPGLPDLFRAEDVRATYQDHSGIAPADLRWYEVYTAMRHAVILGRIHARRVALDGESWPDDPDEVIMHRAVLDQMVDGSWWTAH